MSITLHVSLQDCADQQMMGCSSSKLQFMPAVDGRGYPIKTTCAVEEVGLVAVFEGLQNPQPGRLRVSHYSVQVHCFAPVTDATRTHDRTYALTFCFICPI